MRMTAGVLLASVKIGPDATKFDVDALSSMAWSWADPPPAG